MSSGVPHRRPALGLTQDEGAQADARQLEPKPFVFGVQPFQLDHLVAGERGLELLILRAQLW